VVSSHNPGDIFSPGLTTVTYTATDVNGNFATGSFDVTVNDIQDPVFGGLYRESFELETPFDADDLCATGNEYTPTDANWSLGPACTVPTNGIPQLVDIAGDTYLKYNYKYPAGSEVWNSASLDVTGLTSVTVSFDARSEGGMENTGPYVDDFAMYAVIDGTQSVTPLVAFNGHVDGTGGTKTEEQSFSETVSLSSASSLSLRVVVNISGSDGSESYLINDVAVDAPLLADISLNSDAGVCGAAATWDTPAVYDNCGVTSLVPNHASGTTFAVGTTTVTYTATDAAGNQASDSFTVTVTDNENPTISASDENVTTDTDACTAVVNYTAPTTSDNCEVSSVTYDIADGSTFALGTTTVTATVTDNHSNTNTTTFDVIVTDGQAPNITAEATDLTVECDGAGNNAELLGWLNNNGGATATDNCSTLDSDSWSNDFTTLAYTCGSTSSVSVVFTVTDEAGNESTTQATFTIEDTTDPTLDTPASDETVECDGAGNTAQLQTWLDNHGGAAASEVCSEVTWSHNYGQLDTEGQLVTMSDLCGETGSVLVTFTASDNCDNTVTTQATFTIEDTTPPTAMGQDYTLVLDATGNAVLNPESINNSSSDNCGSVTPTASPLNFDCGDLGPQTVTLTITDACNLTDTQDVTVTVVDQTDPTIVVAASDATYECSSSDDFSTELSQWLANNGGATATDACADGPLTWSYSPNPADLVAACGNTSSVTVTFTVTDPSNNSSDTQATFTIEDTTPPVIASEATDVTVECDGAGNTSDLAAWLASNGGAGIATDECGGVSWSNNFTGLGMTCAGSGAVEVIFTASDDCGNESTTQATFTIEDTTPPSLTVQATDLTVECDGNGNTADLQAWLDSHGGATADPDLCGSNATWDESGYGNVSDLCAATGAVTIDFTLVDDCGNETVSTATFTIEDTTPPVALAHDFSVVLDGTGNASITTADIDNGSYDNCGDVTLSLNITQFTCSDVGAQPVELTVADECGVASTATAIVQVTASDESDPTLSNLPGDITQTADPDMCSAAVTWVNPSVADNCGAGTLTTSHDPNDVFPVGTTTVTFTANDGNGNTSTATMDITVTDDEAPAIAGMPSNMSLSNDAGICGAQASWTAPTATDNCDVASLTGTHPSGTTFAVGTTTVTYTAIDVNGNQTTASFTVTVTDDEDPAISGTPADLTVSNDAGQCSAVVTWTEPTASDNCAVDTFSGDASPGDTFALGTTTVTYTATDVYGNTFTTSFDITVNDDEDPAISGTPANITQTADAGQCGAVVNYTAPTSSDNCGVTSYTSTHDSGDTFAVGTTTVTYTAEDAAGNQTTSSFTVTITDDEDPAIAGTPANITQTADAGQCGAVVNYTAPTSTDNCAVTSFTSTHDSGDTFAVGTTTVTYTAEDAAGNQTTSSFTITVTDDEAPVIASGGGSGEGYALGPISDSGNGTIQEGWTGGAQAYFQNDATDDETVTDAEANSGSNSWFLTDAYGNPGQGSPHAPSLGLPSGTGPGTVFTLEFYFKAEATADGDGSVQKIYQGTYAGDDRTGFNINIKNDTDASGDGLNVFTYSYDAGTGAFPVTTIASNLDRNVWHKVNVTYTIDASGDPNLDTVVYSIDDGAGVSANTWMNVWRVANGFTQAYGDYIAWGGTGNATGFYYDDITYSSDFDGSSQTIGFEAPAGAGLQDITLTNDAGICGAQATWTAPSASDNCALASLTGDANPGDTFPVGSTTVTYTATDVNGNTSTDSFTVTVTDDEDPQFVGMPSDTTLTTDAGLCTAVVNYIAPTASDNCGVASLTGDAEPGDAFGTGTTTVTYTLTDENGNTVTSSFDITVTDGEDPALTNIPADITQTADAGQCSAVVNWEYFDEGCDCTVAPEASDNCGVTSFTSDYSNGDTFPVGTTTVTFTALDAQGNTTTATFDVTITDDENPVISNLPIPAIITQSNDLGDCSAVVTWSAPTVSDNCPNPTLTSTHSPGDTFPVGTTSVTYTATDASSNTAEATFIVIVSDDEDPVITAAGGTAGAALQDITQSNDPGVCNAVVTWDDPTAADNCGVSSFTSTHDSGDTFAVGNTTVTYTAVDTTGNTTTSSFVITVTDDEDPVIASAAQDETVECDGAGNTSALNTWLAANGNAGTVSDNCGFDSWSNDYDPSNFVTNCGQSGHVDVVFTATDIHGNTATTTATFTIEDTTPPYVVPVGLTVEVECDGSGNIADYEAWHALWETGVAVSDVCSGVTYGLVGESVSDDCGETGAATKTYTMTDGCGNSIDTTLSFTIVDTTPPSFNETLPADGTFECDNVPTADILTATDICSGDATVTFTETTTAGTCPDSYTITRTWSTTDDCANTNTHVQTLTIQDTTSPSIDTAASDETVECDGAGNTAAFGAWLANNAGAAASDNCGSVTWSNNSSGLSDLCGATGAETVTFTATDDCGNTSTTTATFTIEDKTDPSMDVASSDLTVECDGAGNTTELNNWLNSNGGASASDICGGVTWSNDFVALSDECGATGSATVIFTATDDCGNTTSTTSTFTIEDTTAPSIDTPSADLTVECDGNGNITELNNWIDTYGGAAASDVCSGVTWSNDFTALSDLCGATGAATVTFTATDDCGLTSTTTATFTIEDTTNPSMDVEASDMTVECDGAGNTTELNNWLASNGGASASDDCSGVTWSNDFVALSDDCGATGSATVTFTATDDCGLATSTTATFTIEDTTPPAFSATAEDLTVECDGAGNLADLNGWLTSNGNAAASDICGGVTWSHDFIALTDDCGETGTTTVTFTVTDDCGNSVYTSAQFTIEDTTAPSLDAAAADLTVECDGAGNSTDLNDWLASNGGASASDDCSSVTWSNDFTALSDDCGATGSATVTFTATDDCGLSISTTATFTIEDTAAPSVDVAASDMTVECDGAGNTAALNSWLTSNGGASASDICGDVTWSNDFTALSDDCGATGTATVTYTATDACGNTSSTTATFTIEDTTAPSMDVASSDMTVECDGSGNPVEFNNWLTSNGGASASDVCSGVTWSNDFTALSDLCGATGAATVTFTAADDCGNTTTTTATFTIEDTTAPVVDGDEVVIIDCSQWPWDALYEPTIDELLAVQDTAGNPIVTLDEACGYPDFQIDYSWMSGGCHYDHQLIYRPVDDCGNMGDTLYQLIQVDDFTDPVFTFVPADTTFSCTDNVMAYLEMATAVDQCDPSVNMTFTDEVVSTACTESYSIIRTFHAEDCGYNIAQATQTITVADTVAPSLTLTAPADVALNGCLSSADTTEATNGSPTWTTTDNCGTVIVTYTVSDSEAYQCTADDATEEGSFIVTRTFTATATDCGGNTTTMSVDQVLTITDDTDPTVSLTAPADVTLYLDATCFAADIAHPVSGDASGFLVDATDNCDTDVAHTITHADDTTYTGTIDGVGSFDILRTYTVTVTDDCGNSASATTSHTIAVLDTLNPSMTPDFPNDTIIYADDSNGYFDPTPSSTGVPSVEYSDNCSGAGENTYGSIGQIVPTGGLIITAIADPNDAASTCRFVEIHNSSDADIDLTGYALQRWTNSNAGPSTGSNIDLSSIGTMAPGTYAWIANNAGFSGCYGFAPTLVGGTGGPADSNGDDNIAIIDGSSNIIDMFGVAGEDGSNTCHEFEDGIALRAGSNTDPNAGAWDEAGWIVYSDGSSASGCTNHNSNQQQNAADIAPLVGNWAGAAPPAPQTDFNTVDITFSDETTSYTASACYTFERTWMITVTDNNGNAMTMTSLQTIQVADTTAPDINAAADATAACDFFGFDLSAGDESTVIGYTSFEEPTSDGQYVDTGDASVDHALENNAGQSDVNYTSAGGELGFSSYYYSTGSNGLTDGDYVGVTSFTGAVGAFTDGGQGFQMQDTDGIMELVLDAVDVSAGGVTLTLDYFVQSTGWETGDRIHIWVVADGGEVDLVDTDYQDIDGLGLEGQWNLASLDLDGYDSAELHISLESNSGSEGLFIDNVLFSQGSSPLAVLEANGYVSFSDNVELATTEAAITYDAAPCEGAYDIAYTATDSCGNLTTVNQRIVLIDTVAPGLTVTEPADTVLFADADCNADYIDGVPYPMASSSDNCDADAAITSYHVDSPKQYACLPSTGAFTVLRTYTFTATDNCGNTTSEQVNRLVTVVDTISPTFNAAAPADITVNIDPFCGANTSTTIAGMPTVTDEADNCDSSVDIEITHEDSAPVYTCSAEDDVTEGSYTFVRTFTVTGTDDCGNETTVTLAQNITALDVASPTILTLPPMATDTYTLDGDCMADLTPLTMPTATAIDACDSEVSFEMTHTDGAPTYNCSDADGEAEGSYVFTRTWTVTASDDCGNTTSQQVSQSIQVMDELDPTLAASWPADYATDLDVDCMADLSPAAAGAATATGDDACDSEVAVAISYDDHDTTLYAINVDAAAEGGFSFIRTWTATATDDCGNTYTETHDQTITANDVTAPAVTLETLPTYMVEGCYGEVDLSPATTGIPTASAEDGCDSEVDVEVTYSTDNLAFNEVVGNYSLVIDTISGMEDGVMGMTTVRMYIETENEGDFISAVAGDAINPTGIRTSTSFYQNVLGGATANSYSTLLEAADPLVAFDSFVTIGLDEQPDGGAGEVATTTVGSWPAAFEAGDDLLINDFFGGSWFTTYPNSAAVAGPDHRVLIGQFTTDGQMSGQVFVQVFPNGVGADEMRLSFTFGDCAEDDDTPEGSYAFTRRWMATGTDDADNLDSAVTYQHVMVLDTEAPQLTNTCGIDNGETVSYDCPGIGVMDFDPVPAACDVQAVDNCDTEVNITLFSESEGYIPTDAIRNYCAPMTPEAQNGSQTCDDRAPEALRLFNFPGADDSFVMADDSENLIQVMADGSVSISMEVTNADGTGGFILSADYGAGQDWATWEAGGSNYKKDCAEIYSGESVWEDWYFFLMNSGSLEGTGMYAGSSFDLSHQPANGYYGMQMGLGANNKNTNYGGSAWFFWQGNLVVDGTDMGPMASSGDIFMDLDCCLEWQVDYFYTAFDDCGNPTGFSYSEAMGASIQDGDADVSGGHTVGPVDITSIGGIKEPIRITGLSPNPTNNQSQLTFLVNENLRLRVDLYNANGLLLQELYDGNAVTGVQYTMDIDVDDLAAGMYQVRISSASYIAVKKLLVAE